MASADGMRFVIPVSTIHAAYNPRYFGRQRGSTLYSWMADTYTVFAQKLIPGTQRDSLYVLDGLLANQTGIRPRWYPPTPPAPPRSCSPWPGPSATGGHPGWPTCLTSGSGASPHARYGPLNGLARHRINTRLIAENWDEICRLTASLRAGTVIPSAILRTLQRGPSPSSLARALAELGRVIKTLHVLEYGHDPAYRRTIHHLLSRGESRNSLARDVFHGQRGQIRKHYQAGQENQLDSLGIMINIIVLWQTLYIQAALDHLAANGYQLDPADVARLTPLGHPTINLQRPLPHHQPTTHRRAPATTQSIDSGSCTNPRHRPSSVTHSVCSHTSRPGSGPPSSGASPRWMSCCWILSSPRFFILIKLLMLALRAYARRFSIASHRWSTSVIAADTASSASSGLPPAKMTSRTSGW